MSTPGGGKMVPAFMVIAVVLIAGIVAALFVRAMPHQDAAVVLPITPPLPAQPLVPEAVWDDVWEPGTRNHVEFWERDEVRRLYAPLSPAWTKSQSNIPPAGSPSDTRVKILIETSGAKVRYRLDGDEKREGVLPNEKRDANGRQVKMPPFNSVQFQAIGSERVIVRMYLAQKVSAKD